MNSRIENKTLGIAASLMFVGLAVGCGQKATPVAPLNGAASVAAANPADVPVVVNGPEMTQSVPPPPEVAANPNSIEIVHNLPPVPAHLMPRHKRLHLVKYEDKYWLQDVDHHCYAAARDNSGHYYPACYDSSDSTVYPLYYDSQRDDYYRACSDHDNHHFRCYEDEPDYVYYNDPDPVYVAHGHGWNAEYEPEVDAPAYNASWGVSIPVFSVALFVLPAWHSRWWAEGGWSSGGDTFADISLNRPYFNYYTVPSDYPFVYANTLYVSNAGSRTDPNWYQHGQFNQTEYQRGAYRSFSGYAHPAAAGTLAAVYLGSNAFHAGANPSDRGRSNVISNMSIGAVRQTPGSFARGNAAPVMQNLPMGHPNSTGSPGHFAAAATHPASGTFSRGGAAATAGHNGEGGHPAVARTPSIHAPAGAAHSTSGSFNRGNAAITAHSATVGHTANRGNPAGSSRIGSTNQAAATNRARTIAHARPIAGARPSITPSRPASAGRTMEGGTQARNRQAPPAPARTNFRNTPEPNRAPSSPPAPAHNRQQPPVPARQIDRSQSNNRQAPPTPARQINRSQSNNRPAPPAPARQFDRSQSNSRQAPSAPPTQAHNRQAQPAPARPSSRTAPSPPRAQPTNHGSADKGGSDDKRKP